MKDQYWNVKSQIVEKIIKLEILYWSTRGLKSIFSMCEWNSSDVVALNIGDVLNANVDIDSLKWIQKFDELDWICRKAVNKILM